MDPLTDAPSPFMNDLRLRAIWLMLLSHGIHDSAPGALIPHREDNYHIGHAVRYVTDSHHKRRWFTLAVLSVPPKEHNLGHA